MIVDLSTEEVNYILASLVMAREYYRVLAGSSRVGLSNLAKYRLVEGLGTKLEAGIISSSDEPR